MRERTSDKSFFLHLLWGSVSGSTQPGVRISFFFYFNPVSHLPSKVETSKLLKTRVGSLKHKGGRKWWASLLDWDGRRQWSWSHWCHKFHQTCKNRDGGTYLWQFLLPRGMLKGILMKYFSNKDKKKEVGWRPWARIWDERCGHTWAAAVAEASGRASGSSELASSSRQGCQPRTSFPSCSSTELCPSCWQGKLCIYPTISLAVPVRILDSQNMV